MKERDEFGEALASAKTVDEVLALLPPEMLYGCHDDGYSCPHCPIYRWFVFGRKHYLTVDEVTAHIRVKHPERAA